jgi:hypothetical protein
MILDFEYFGNILKFMRQDDKDYNASVDYVPIDN